MGSVAFLGLGVMGFPIAGHLKNKGGNEVTVYNRTPEKVEKWVAKYGGRSARTPKEAAVGCELVFACVGNDDDLRSVVLGPNGAFAGMGKGAIFVVAVDWMRKDLSICFDEARSGFPFAKIAPLPWKLLRPLFLHLGLLSLRS